MNLKNTIKAIVSAGLLTLALGTVALSTPSALAAGGTAVASSSSPRTDVIKASKVFYASANKTVLISASSSNAEAVLTAYLPSGKLLGRLQNGSFNRYGGTVFWVGADPVWITIKSSAGGSIKVPTSPYKP